MEVIFKYLNRIVISDGCSFQQCIIFCYFNWPQNAGGGGGGGGGGGKGVASHLLHLVFCRSACIGSKTALSKIRSS